MLNRKLLLGLTAIYLVVVTVYVYEQKTIIPFHVEKEISQEDPGRNERSTQESLFYPLLRLWHERRKTSINLSFKEWI